MLGFFKKIKERQKLMHESKEVPETARDKYGPIQSTSPAEVKKQESKVPSSLNVDHSVANNSVADDQNSLVSKNISNSFSNSVSSDVSVTPGSDIQEPRRIEEQPLEKKESKNQTQEEAGNEGSEAIKTQVGHEKGFFKSVHENLSTNKDASYLSEVLQKDLLSKMREFHSSDEPFFFHSEDSKEGLSRTLEELKMLEEEWYVRHRNLKESEVLLLEKESEIDRKLEELKQVIQHIKNKSLLEKQAPKDKYFFLDSGRVIRSIGELKNTVMSIKDDIFRKHVNEHKNDFADWVEHVFEDRSLATKLRRVTSKEEILKLISEH